MRAEVGCEELRTKQKQLSREQIREEEEVGQEQGGIAGF